MPPYERPDNSWVLEGLITTVRPEPAGTPLEHRVNIAPMGPIVEGDGKRLVLRPFKTSATYRNLKAHGEGVFHITDDVLLLARAAIRHVSPGPDVPMKPAKVVRGLVLAGACRYHEFRVDSLDDVSDRTTIVCRIVHSRRLRDFFGLNRGKHAVLEAAILATRLHLTGAEAVLAELTRLDSAVAKTGGRAERQAMSELRAYVESWQASQQPEVLDDADADPTERTL
jgi:hypothetical protein